MGFVNVECRSVARKTFKNNQSARDCSILSRVFFASVLCGGRRRSDDLILRGGGGLGEASGAGGATLR